MKNIRIKLRYSTVFVVGMILFLSIVSIPQARAQVFPFFGIPGIPSFSPLQAFPPFPVISPFRTAAIPLANFTPVTVTVPQVTTAGLTITGLVPTLAPPPTPTLSVIVNLTAGTFLPTTFVAPFPLTPLVAPALPTVSATVTLPPAVPTLTSIIALNLGGGIPGLTGGGTILNTVPLPVPTTALPVIQVPTTVAPTTIPVI